jgi:hypothetical protein
VINAFPWLRAAQMSMTEIAQLGAPSVATFGTKRTYSGRHEPSAFAAMFGLNPL